MLQATGAPDPEEYPTGRELVEQYLLPLAALSYMHAALLLHTRVITVTRQGFDKRKSPGREDAPFALRLQGSDGVEREVVLVLPETGVCSTDAGGSCGVPGATEGVACCALAVLSLLSIGLTRRSSIRKR